MYLFLEISGTIGVSAFWEELELARETFGYFRRLDVGRSSNVLGYQPRSDSWVRHLGSGVGGTRSVSPSNCIPFRDDYPTMSMSHTTGLSINETSGPSLLMKYFGLGGHLISRR